MAKDSFYFQHDYNAANDVKILFLRQQLGMEGYGIFWYLVEQLAQNGGKLPVNITPVLAMQMQVPEVKVKAIIEGFGLFILTNEEFESKRLNEHLQIRKQIQEGAKKGALTRWNNAGGNALPNAGGNALPNAGGNAKERKGKKRKEVNKSIGFNECLLYDRNEFAKHFEGWNKEKLKYYYEAADNYSSQGHKYVDWGKAIKNWANKDEASGKKLAFNEPNKILNPDPILY